MAGPKRIDGGDSSRDETGQDASFGVAVPECPAGPSAGAQSNPAVDRAPR
jgi:hypothetical protein